MVFFLKILFLKQILNSYQDFRHMPTRVELLQIVISKAALEAKYPGGLEKFKIDWEFGRKVDHEDEEIITFGSMGDAFPVPEGLDYDEANNASEDFGYAGRYGAADSPNPSWMKCNMLFIWHEDSYTARMLDLKDQSEMTMSDFNALVDKFGEYPEKDIW